MTTDEKPIYESGDVVYGADPYKGDEASRPWLVISNHEGRPFHGEQYITLSLTTKTWMEGLIEIESDDWIRGGTPETSHVVPWGVQSIGGDDINHWQGRVNKQLVTGVTGSLVDYIVGS